jgi:hypothetical protein
MNQRLTSRKFLVALLALASASVLCWFKRIDAGVYATVVVGTVGAYLTANVAQKRAAAP